MLRKLTPMGATVLVGLLLNAAGALIFWITAVEYATEEPPMKAKKIDIIKESADLVQACVRHYSGLNLDTGKLMAVLAEHIGEAETSEEWKAAYINQQMYYKTGDEKYLYGDEE